MYPLLSIEQPALRKLISKADKPPVAKMQTIKASGLYHICKTLLYLFQWQAGATWAQARWFLFPVSQTLPFVCRPAPEKRKRQD